MAKYRKSDKMVLMGLGAAAIVVVGVLIYRQRSQRQTMRARAFMRAQMAKRRV